MTALKSAPARRRFLALLTGAAAAPVAVALPAIAATTAPAITEAPELLAIGELIAGLADALLVAVARHDAEKLKLEQTKPAVLPDELWAPERHWRSSFTECRGGGDEPVRWIYISKKVRSEIILNDISRHTKEGRRLRRIARIAKAYEDAHRAVWDTIDYFPTYDASRAAAAEYIASAEELLHHAPVTMKGVLIIAGVLAFLPKALAAAGFTDPKPAPMGQLGAHLADALLRIEGRAGA